MFVTANVKFRVIVFYIPYVCLENFVCKKLYSCEGFKEPVSNDYYEWKDTHFFGEENYIANKGLRLKLFHDQFWC
jgi:hypothetical protein